MRGTTAGRDGFIRKHFDALVDWIRTPHGEDWERAERHRIAETMVAEYLATAADRNPTIAATPSCQQGSETGARAGRENWTLAPPFRGYALLGAGAYLLNNSDASDPAELVISIATDAEKEGRVVGDLRDNTPGTEIQPETMAVRIGFDSVAGLDALEQQLRLLRAEHFPKTHMSCYFESDGGGEFCKKCGESCLAHDMGLAARERQELTDPIERALVLAVDLAPYHNNDVLRACERGLEAYRATLTNAPDSTSETQAVAEVGQHEDADGRMWPVLRWTRDPLPIGTKLYTQQPQAIEAVACVSISAESARFGLRDLGYMLAPSDYDLAVIVTSPTKGTKE